MKAHRNLTLGLFACLFLLGSCTDSEMDVKIIFGENAQWTGILGFIMGSKNYVRDIL